MENLVAVVIVIAILSALVDAIPARRGRRHRRSRNSGGDAIFGVGCLVIFGIFMAIGVISMVWNFIKVYQKEVIVCSIIVAFLGLVAFVAYICWKDVATRNPPSTGSVDFHNNKNQESSDNKTPDLPGDEPKESGDQFAATIEEIVGKVPSAKEMAGKLGEDAVSKAVWAACQCDGRYFKLLRNVYIKKLNGEYSEIDALLLHETGVYVFESKNLSGSIYGDMNHLQWKRYKSNGNFDYIPNPIKQNEGHIRALMEFLWVNKWQFRVFSMIVFGTRARLNHVPDGSAFTSIHEVYNLEMDLMKKMTEGKVFYNAETIDDWCKKLLPCTMLSDEEKQAHVERITKKFRKV